MADPLTVVGGIAGVVGIADALTRGCVKLLQAFSDAKAAPEDVRDLIDGLENLHLIA
jgi:hypothetical protein